MIYYYHNCKLKIVTIIIYTYCTVKLLNIAKFNFILLKTTKYRFKNIFSNNISNIILKIFDIVHKTHLPKLLS